MVGFIAAMLLIFVVKNRQKVEQMNYIMILSKILDTNFSNKF